MMGSAGVSPPIPTLEPYYHFPLTENGNDIKQGVTPTGAGNLVQFTANGAMFQRNAANSFLTYVNKLDATKCITYSAKMLYTATPPTGNWSVAWGHWQYYLSPNYWASPNIAWLYNTGRNRISIAFTNGTGTIGYVSADWQSTPSINTWYEISVVISEGYQAIYINKEKIAEFSQQIRLPKTANILHLNSYNDDSRYGLDGYIKDLRIFDRVLTEQEIQSL